jgi:hypothetical protein
MVYFGQVGPSVRVTSTSNLVLWQMASAAERSAQDDQTELNFLWGLRSQVNSIQFQAIGPVGRAIGAEKVLGCLVPGSVQDTGSWTMTDPPTVPRASCDFLKM